MAKFQEIIIEPDTRANQPAANTVPVGALYCVTDEENILERSNGTTWDPFSPSGAPAGVILDDGTVPMAADLDLGGNKIVDVDDPTAAQDAATKNYVDTEIAAAAVNANAANVTTGENQTGGGAYADLATSGPSVTLTTGATVIVWLSCTANKASNGNSAFISVAVSGATTLAASDANAAAISQYAAGHNLNLSRVLLLSGLTPGSNTFKMQYKNDGGTWTFSNRSIAVLAL